MGGISSWRALNAKVRSLHLSCRKWESLKVLKQGRGKQTGALREAGSARCVGVGIQQSRDKSQQLCDGQEGSA